MRNRFAAVAAVSLGLMAAGTAARAQDANSFDRFYPPAAKAAGVNGYVMLNCLVKDDHTLADCRVVQEMPVGMGFGEASLRASRTITMRITTREGDSIEGASFRVNIPIRWNLDHTAAPNGSSPRR